MKSTTNHYKAFDALRKVEPALDAHGVTFDEMRATRNDSVYEPTHDEAELAERLSDARELMPASMAALRKAILSVRPDLVARLPHVGSR